jgi:hypothetical protein
MVGRLDDGRAQMLHRNVATGGGLLWMTRDDRLLVEALAADRLLRWSEAHRKEAVKVSRKWLVELP